MKKNVQTNIFDQVDNETEMQKKCLRKERFETLKEYNLRWNAFKKTL